MQRPRGDNQQRILEYIKSEIQDAIAFGFIGPVQD